MYLNKYVGDQQYSSKKEKRIVGLGRTEQALMQLKMWEIDKRQIPIEVKSEHHSRIPVWIDAVRNRGAY